jgi:3',5'-cyclic AMP phosphodiesterase CpdA
LFCVLLFILFSSQAFATTFSFAVFGDSHNGYEIYKKILKKVGQDRSIVFAVHVGDFTEAGTLAEYQKYLSINKTANFPIYSVLGNHDAYKGGWRNFLKLIGPLNYSFDYENSHFIVVNNAFRGFFDLDQLYWLEKELKTNKDKNLFVFFHKPLFDPLEMDNNHVMDSRHLAEKLEALFSQYRVKYVFAGHLHAYGRADKDGVTYIVASGAGTPKLMPALIGGIYHFVKVTVSDDRAGDEMIELGEYD